MTSTNDDATATATAPTGPSSAAPHTAWPAHQRLPSVGPLPTPRVAPPPPPALPSPPLDPDGLLAAVAASVKATRAELEGRGLPPARALEVAEEELAAAVGAARAAVLEGVLRRRAARCRELEAELRYREAASQQAFAEYAEIEGKARLAVRVSEIVERLKLGEDEAWAMAHKERKEAHIAGMKAWR